MTTPLAPRRSRRPARIVLATASCTAALLLGEVGWRIVLRARDDHARSRDFEIVIVGGSVADMFGVYGVPLRRGRQPAPPPDDRR